MTLHDRLMAALLGGDMYGPGEGLVFIYVGDVDMYGGDAEHAPSGSTSNTFVESLHFVGSRGPFVKSLENIIPQV